MTKRLLALLMGLSLVLSLAACGGDKENETTDTPAGNETTIGDEASSDLKAVYDKCTEKMPEMMPLDASMMLDYCGIKAEDCEEFFVSICADSLRTDEIWLIKAKDGTVIENLSSLATARLKAKGDESITYSPEQYEVVQKAKVITKGNYFALLVSPDAAALEAIVNESIAN